MSKSNINAGNRGKLFVISGPSGVGKTSVVVEAIKRLSKDNDISKVITCTSRLPRGNEANSKDYHFMSKQDFIQKMKAGFFLETAEFDGNFYGSPSSILADLELGKSFLAILDLEGVKSVSKIVHDAIFIWFSVSDDKELKLRLKKRKTESENKIEKRYQKALQEIQEAHHIRVFRYKLVNDDFERSVEELVGVVKMELG